MIILGVCCTRNLKGLGMKSILGVMVLEMMVGKTLSRKGMRYILGWYRKYNGDIGEGIIKIFGEEGKGDVRMSLFC